MFVAGEIKQTLLRKFSEVFLDSPFILKPCIAFIVFSFRVILQIPGVSVIIELCKFRECQGQKVLLKVLSGEILILGDYPGG